MSELRRPGGDDPDKPAVNDQAADKPATRPKFELRTTDMDANWPVDRRAVTKTQRAYIESVRQNGGPPAPRDTGIGYARDWSTGESLDHKFPSITGAEDRPKPDDDPTGATVRDRAPDTPSVSTPMPPTLQHATATGVERLRAADAASRMDRAERDGDRSHLDGEREPAAKSSLSPADIPDLARPSGTPDTTPDKKPEPDDSGHEARTLQRTDSEPADFGEIAKRVGPDRRVRAEIGKSAETATKGVGKGAETVQDVLSHKPPPGQAVTKSPESMSSIGDQHAMPSLGDIASAAVATGLVLGAAGNKIHETIKGRKERRASNE